MRKEDPEGRTIVILHELTMECAVSNPTGLFNLSLPHIELKMANFETLNYANYKLKQEQEERRKTEMAKVDDEEMVNTQDEEDDAQVKEDKNID